ncbi:hypothetical protein CCUS01_00243 [Colletotrichum cuscutae]|uniref:Uncharacterized protein n=1 Tax=Colletotrichum cuscutae TaxID=1209917 RepID=A0AAJ0DRF7_9PEZI|nr:hypothetical protein CCUS01_00243 [Colletotrichum cuscutae]
MLRNKKHGGKKKKFSGCIESFGPHRGTARKGALAIRSFMLCGAGLAVGTNTSDALSPNTRSYKSGYRLLSDLSL